MPNGHDDPQDQRDDADEDVSGDARETEPEPESAKTRAGSNLPNAAGNRDDGTHE